MSYTVYIKGDDKVMIILDKLRDLHIALLEELQDRIYEKAKIKLIKIKRTGTLLSSLDKGGVGDFLYVLMGNPRAYYAPYVERGTRPHMIYPRRARALRFEVRGKTVFAKYVRHPGTEAKWIMRDSAEEALKEFRRILRRKVLELIR